MYLKYLKLENIRSYINETINFPSGKLLLSGDIGSGKSTILLAIEFALFGINKSDLSGFHLLRHGKNFCSVELCFDIDNIEYIIKRALKKNRDNINQDIGYIIKNGKKFEGTPSELRAKIIEILGYPEELITKSKTNIYRYTVYCPQEEMKKILFENSETRLDTLRKLFNIDKYKTIRENADFYARELRRKINEVSIKLDTYIEIENEIKEKKQKIEELEKIIKNEILILSEISEKTKNQKNKYEELENRVKKLNELKKDVILNDNIIKTKKQFINSLETKKQNILKKILSYEEKLNQYKNITELKPEKQIEDEVNKLIEEFNQYIKEKSILEQKLNNYNEQITKIENEIKEINEKIKKTLILEKEIKDIEEKLKLKKEQEKLLDETLKKDNAIKIKLEKIDYSISQSRKIIDNIKNADICPLCYQKVNDEHKKEVINKENNNILNLEKEKETIKKIEDKINENIKKIKTNLEKLEKLQETYNQKSKELTILIEQTKNSASKQKELSELILKKEETIEKLKVKEKNFLKQEIEEKKKILSEFRDYNLKFREKNNIIEYIKNEKENIKKIDEEVSQIKTEINEIEEKIKKINEQIKDYINSEKEYIENKKEYENLKEIEKNKEIEISTLTKEKTIIQNQIREYEKKLEAMEILKKKISELKDLEEFISTFFINLMITIEKHIMVSIHKEFESLLKEWFSMLIEGLEISLEDDFSIKIIQDGYESSIENLSGGEKTAVALAYRLALNKVINDLISNIKTKDFIILDEPTDGFSSEQLDKVRDVLEQLNMKQTIIVSHEQKMESYVNNIIRITKTNNISKVNVL